MFILGTWYLNFRVLRLHTARYAVSVLINRSLSVCGASSSFRPRGWKRGRTAFRSHPAVVLVSFVVVFIASQTQDPLPPLHYSLPWLRYHLTGAKTVVRPQRWYHVFVRWRDPWECPHPKDFLYIELMATKWYLCVCFGLWSVFGQNSYRKESHPNGWTSDS